MIKGNINRKPQGVAMQGRLYRTYISNAKRSNRQMLLTRDEFVLLTQGDCFYCGEKPSSLQFKGKDKVNGGYLYNGIDRVDNNKTYTIDNCVSCCSRCNTAKNDMTRDQYIQLCRNVIKCEEIRCISDTSSREGASDVSKKIY